MRVKARILLISLPLLGLIPSVNAQTLVRGRVLDKDTHEPLELAVVTDLHTGKKTITDDDGDFTLKMPAPAPLSVSMVGHTTETLTAPSGTPLIIFLPRGILDLKEVTITNSTAAGGVGSFHTLSNIDLNLRPVRSAQYLLRLVPGLFIAQHQGGGKAEQSRSRERRSKCPGDHQAHSLDQIHPQHHHEARLLRPLRLTIC